MTPAVRLGTLLALVFLCLSGVCASQNRLESALAEWRDMRDGPLIAIEPELVRPFADQVLMRKRNPSGKVGGVPLLPDTPFDGVLEYFGRKRFKLGSITSVAPTEMAVLNTRPGQHDLLASLKRNDRLRVLCASLSLPQRRRLASPDGLGVADCPPNLRSLFLSLLPDPFIVREARVERGQLQSRGRVVSLGPEARARVRLRLNRLARYRFAATDPANTWVQINDGRPDTDGESILYLENDFDIRRDHDFGAELIRYLPNRQKRGHLEFDHPSLAKWFPLRTVDAVIGKPGPETVGGMVERISKAVGVELYADVRIAGLKVWTAGRMARAGDILRALSLAVTGTFRKVGPAYVLTDDLEGIGSRLWSIEEWKSDGALKLKERLYAAGQTLRKLNFAKEVRLDPGTPQPVSSKQLSKVSPAWGMEEDDKSYLELAFTELPGTWQARFRQIIERAVPWTPPGVEIQHARAGTQTVRIHVSLNVSYLVPDVGVVESGARAGSRYASFGSAPSPPGTNPEFKGALPLPEDALRALHVAPESAEETARIAREAKSHGFSHLWLELPDTGAKEMLEAGVKSCRELQIAVVPVVRLLYRRVSPPDAKDMDLNVVGETASSYQKRRDVWPLEWWPAHWRERFARKGDWLRFDTPETKSAIIARAVSIASTQGISGLVLQATAAPGYLDSGQQKYGTPIRSGWDFGHLSDYRLELLRTAGADPIDLPALIGGTTPSLPFFPNRSIEASGNTTVQKWHALRNRKNGEFLAELFDELSAKANGVSVMLEGRWSEDTIIFPSRFVPWVKRDQDPSLDPAVRGDGPRGLAAVYCFSHLTWRLADPPGMDRRWYDVSPLRKDDPAAFGREAANVLRTESAKGLGIAIDLTDLPIDRAVEFLRAMPLP